MTVLNPFRNEHESSTRPHFEALYDGGRAIGWIVDYLRELDNKIDRLGIIIDSDDPVIAIRENDREWLDLDKTTYLLDALRMIRARFVKERDMYVEFLQMTTDAIEETGIIEVVKELQDTLGHWKR